MVGVDITRIKRFKNKDDYFAKRILSNEEFFEYSKLENLDLKSKFLATRWAIKEAIFKADNSKNEFSKLNILKNNNIYSYENFAISTSNEADFIIAFVIKK